MAESNADRDYGFSGRDVQDGNYSGAYGRGQAGETDAPSGGGGGSLGAGYGADGTELPRPDVEGGPVSGDSDVGGAGGGAASGGMTGGDLAGGDLASGGLTGPDVTPDPGGAEVM